ncbi:MAG: hypothetical protein NT045_02155 [Candidatus Aureabacteria bacterium]|nr:hypothetical protein [Candidatus Auribacterota bacterium]
MTREIDFGIAWEWEHDGDFIDRLVEACRARTIETCVVDPRNCAELTQAVLRDELVFTTFFDRASDTNRDFLPLAGGLVQDHAFFINHPADVEKAINKAAMHLEFIMHGISVPYTIILPVFEKDPTDRIIKLDTVGIPFIVKPAHGGGGVGVLVGARTLSEVMAARQDFQDDQILIQENIVPRIIEGKRAWFRVYYIGGAVTICWWDPEAHIYGKVTPEESARWGLTELERMARVIHSIAKLNFFSTEIAITESLRFVSVDYVNDQCDMRLKSKAPDAVPDEVVGFVCEQLAAFVERSLAQKRAAGIA